MQSCYWRVRCVFTVVCSCAYLWIFVCRYVHLIALPLRDNSSWIHRVRYTSGSTDSHTRSIFQVMHTCNYSPALLFSSFSRRLQLDLSPSSLLTVFHCFLGMDQVNDTIGTRRAVRRTADSESQRTSRSGCYIHCCATLLQPFCTRSIYFTCERCTYRINFISSFPQFWHIATLAVSRYWRHMERFFQSKWDPSESGCFISVLWHQITEWDQTC